MMSQKLNHLRADLALSCKCLPAERLHTCCLAWTPKWVWADEPARQAGAQSWALLLVKLTHFMDCILLGCNSDAAFSPCCRSGSPQETALAPLAHLAAALGPRMPCQSLLLTKVRSDTALAAALGHTRRMALLGVETHCVS